MRASSTGTENKSIGSFYTPEWCVDALLDISHMSDLESEDLVKAKIIDPACGDGAILSRIIERFAPKMLANNIERKTIKDWIENRIFGIEIDEDEANKCRKNITLSAKQACDIDIDESALNIITEDAFDAIKNPELSLVESFDYVIGNPPYVRIHNLESKPDSDYIVGMCDLYLAFYDIGQQMLSKDGTLCYISPSSWMTSAAGKNMREALEKQGNIKAIMCFEHFQVFDNATTYTAIVSLSHPSKKNDKIERWHFVEKTHRARNKSFLKHEINESAPETLWIDGLFYPSSTELAAQILRHERMNASENIHVRNGYATLADKIFLFDKACEQYNISNEINAYEDLKKLSIEVVKASTGNKCRMLYPYDKNGKILDIDAIKKISPTALSWLNDNKDSLSHRSKIKPELWYGFGRTQGIVDTFANKVSVQTIVKPYKEVVVSEAKSGCGVYGGVYVTGMDIEDVKLATSDPAFMEYVRTLGKFKSGGYYSLSGKELEHYLAWWVDTSAHETRIDRIISEHENRVGPIAHDEKLSPNERCSFSSSSTTICTKSKNEDIIVAVINDIAPSFCSFSTFCIAPKSDLRTYFKALDGYRIESAKRRNQSFKTATEIKQAKEKGRWTKEESHLAEKFDRALLREQETYAVHGSLKMIADPTPNVYATAIVEEDDVSFLHYNMWSWASMFTAKKVSMEILWISFKDDSHIKKELPLATENRENENALANAVSIGDPIPLKYVRAIRCRIEKPSRCCQTEGTPGFDIKKDNNTKFGNAKYVATTLFYLDKMFHSIYDMNDDIEQFNAKDINLSRAILRWIMGDG